MRRRFSTTQKIVSAGALLAFLSCSGPMVDVQKKADVPKPEITAPNVPNILLSCKDVRLEAGKILVDVIGRYPSNPFLEEFVTVDLSNAGLSKKNPLDFFCNANNELILVSRESVDFLELHPTFGRFSVSITPVLGMVYTDVIEYALEGTNVIEAGVLKDPSLSWDKTPIATVTNTGVLQVGTYSMHTFETGEYNRFLYDLRLSQVLPEEQRWPKEGVARAVVSMIDDKTVCVIPLGESWQSVKYFYLVHYTGEKYKDLADVIVLTMMPQSKAPDLRNILSATVPSYNPAEGKGLHVVLEYETNSGGSSLIAVLLPDPKEVFKE